ncbi:MAG: hypothetical protein O7A04_03545, partial [Acidobacteria bacterium]|nr:hypothetical protein [Acidobacteriota bacterium]
MSKRSPKELRHRHSGSDGEADRLTAHRGLATWGERLVPLGDFHRATARSGRKLSAAEREAAAADYLALPEDPTAVEGQLAPPPQLLE